MASRPPRSPPLDDESGEREEEEGEDPRDLVRVGEGEVEMMAPASDQSTRGNKEKVERRGRAQEVNHDLAVSGRRKRSTLANPIRHKRRWVEVKGGGRSTPIQMVS